ncbi:MAG TPA: DUF2283 domain-containing protein [Candidatus Acetothermia bacterium]|nr:DUF2283 domain-containing protein [Candidatus Acetothermia bacterium]
MGGERWKVKSTAYFRNSAESEEIAPGFVLDFDTEGNVVGIEIEDASRKVELDRLELSALPLLDLIVTRPAATHGKKWRTVFGR